MKLANCEIRLLRHSDVHDAVRIHLAAFPTFFLSSLGGGFLKQLYMAFIKNKSCIALVAVENGELRGVVVGTTEPSGFFRILLLRRWWAFAASGAGYCLRHPCAIPRILRALRYRGDAPAGGNRALLSSIAVDPDVQARGLGTSLISAWVEQVRIRGSIGCYLLTDAYANETVNRFYQRQGWHLDSTHTTPEGRLMNCYTFDFPRNQ